MSMCERSHNFGFPYQCGLTVDESMSKLKYLYIPCREIRCYTQLSVIENQRSFYRNLTFSDRTYSNKISLACSYTQLIVNALWLTLCL